VRVLETNNRGAWEGLEMGLGLHSHFGEEEHYLNSRDA
jgi:hypothetical protein